MTLTSEQVEITVDPRAQYERAIEDRWSDGVPMLPATDDAIEALLAATPYPADHALCVLPPINGVATVELIAINAAMAGVEPAAFPYVIAALEVLDAVVDGGNQIWGDQWTIPRPDWFRPKP